MLSIAVKDLLSFFDAIFCHQICLKIYFQHDKTHYKFCLPYVLYWSWLCWVHMNDWRGQDWSNGRLQYLLVEASCPLQSCHQQRRLHVDCDSFLVGICTEASQWKSDFVMLLSALHLPFQSNHCRWEICILKYILLFGEIFILMKLTSVKLQIWSW